MGKVVTTVANIKKLNKDERVVLDIITNLEKANFGLNLFTKRPKSRIDPLLEHEKPISIMITAAALYESVLQFNSIKGKARIEIKNYDNAEVNTALDFLCGKKVEEFKSNILNAIRNKSTFHTDAEIIDYYLNNAGLSDDEEIVIWQENKDGSNNYPIANDVLSFWFLNSLNERDFLANVIFMGQLFNDLRTVVHFLLMKWYGASVIKS
ncbi:hypothetical protein GCM10008018_60320 [Paenibacillus marchantiophytorum]|uniref:Uncharacterized protein n=1 Tax=Paenibacillus marchantiophytorum TaxID=1619310 RepID=A0ABQ1FDT5_9BACL|nr:hypothetical protein [Paenibacillus marchantiophytorum]GGA06403.1 hypothetical protein GCM10008018_60320 [Paenibacillus marchantiophytorum]